MSKPAAKPSTPPAAATDSPAPATTPTEAQAAALAAEGDPTEVTADDVRVALGLPPKGTLATDSTDAETDATDSDDDLTDEERTAAAAELADDEAADDDDLDASADETTPAAAKPPATSAAEPTEALTKAQAALAAAEAARLASEQEAATLRERLAAREAADATRTDPAAVDGITDLEDLASTRRRFVNLYAWATQHPDGGDLPDGKGGSVPLSREEVLALQANAFTLVHEAVPAREAYLRTAAAREADALNAYPWLKDSARGLGAEATKILAAAPGLRRLPDHKLVAGDAALGARLRAAGVQLDEATLTRMVEAAKSGKSAAPGASARPGTPAATAPRVPPSAPRAPGIVPPRVRGAEAAVAQAKKRIRAEGGSTKSIEASIAAKLAR